MIRFFLLWVLVGSFLVTCSAQTNETFIIKDDYHSRLLQKEFAYDWESEAYIKERFGDGVTVDNNELIAWCIKLGEHPWRPKTFEEAIWLIEVRKDAEKFWVLTYVRRNPDIVGKGRSQWSSRVSGSKMDFMTQFTRKPDDKEMGKFIYDSWFGFNNFFPYVEVLKVCTFSNYEKHFDLLRNGVPLGEKKKRYAEYLKLLMH